MKRLTYHNLYTINLSDLVSRTANYTSCSSMQSIAEVSALRFFFEDIINCKASFEPATGDRVLASLVLSALSLLSIEDNIAMCFEPTFGFDADDEDELGDFGTNSCSRDNKSNITRAVIAVQAEVICERQ